MKFMYCRNCKTIQKRNWYSFFNCRRCGGEGVIISVKTGILGYVAYATSFLAFFLVVARLFEYELGISDIQVYLMFGLLFLSIGCMFIEIGREEAIAREKANDPRLR